MRNKSTLYQLHKKTSQLDIKGREGEEEEEEEDEEEEIYFVNVLTEIPLVHELKHFLQTKRQKREEGGVSALRCNDTILTQGGGVVTGADEWAEVVEV